LSINAARLYADTLRMILRLLMSVLMALVPLSAAAAPVLRAGSDISYAPLEFYASGSHRIQGFDYEVARSLAAQLAVPLQFANHDFNDLLGAVSKGRLDFAISAISDTRARERQVDFIDYFLAGSGILVRAGNPHRIYNIAGLCGMTVDLQRGTSQETAVNAQSKRCREVGLKPVTVQAYATDDVALKEFLAGRSVAHISDYPVVAHLARTLGGGKAYQVAGVQFGVVPYGIAVAKNNAVLRDRLQRALQAVIASGEYDRLLAKWGLEQGAMRSAPINAGTKFEM
jgi:polar amino acid transport system substrate-binding protein